MMGGIKQTMEIQGKQKALKAWPSIKDLVAGWVRTQENKMSKALCMNGNNKLFFISSL